MESFAGEVGSSLTSSVQQCVHAISYLLVSMNSSLGCSGKGEIDESKNNSSFWYFENIAEFLSALALMSFVLKTVVKLSACDTISLNRCLK